MYFEIGTESLSLLARIILKPTNKLYLCTVRAWVLLRSGSFFFYYSPLYCSFSGS